MPNGAEQLIAGEDYGFALDFIDNSSAIGLPLNAVGVGSVGQVGAVEVKGGVGVSVSGVGCIGLVSDSSLIFIWSQIDTNQTPNWTAVTDAQSPNWTQIAA